ncbi:MAG: hypothetical protein ABI947_20600 [Chloroflexota bacterium]
MPAIVPIALFIGFLVGIVVNLFADYLPAQRHYKLATTNPFGSHTIIAKPPTFLPCSDNGSLWPIWLWSGLIATSLRQPVGDSHNRRRIITEIGMAAAFAAIAWRFSEIPNLPFLLFYAAALALIVIIDVENRWVFLETIIPVGIVALVEAVLWPRSSLEDTIRGGLYGFGILFALYLFGLVFARVLGMVTGRQVGRTVLGFGDVYIGSLGGLIIGKQFLGLSLLIMVLTGAIAALILITNRWLRTKRYRLYSAIPYGPYIVIGTVAMLYVPEMVGDIVRRILNWPF